ncbi:hypothetical protein EDB83DRAFT_2322431 [Lactarius deliciosus]|nr:hypothetical protein EDB83DRAFT_2322431 [Lactarius deliciosus]
MKPSAKWTKAVMTRQARDKEGQSRDRLDAFHLRTAVSDRPKLVKDLILRGNSHAWLKHLRTMTQTLRNSSATYCYFSGQLRTMMAKMMATGSGCSLAAVQSRYDLVFPTTTGDTRVHRRGAKRMIRESLWGAELV